MRHGIGSVVLLCLTAFFINTAGAADAEAPRRVKVLILGDNGHHAPLERCRQAYSVFGRRGIDFVYTQDLTELNPANLARYDCLLVYANITKIAPDQEKAILEYVAAGHGYVPLHCASYCFLNSAPLTALTGARFKSHGTGTFKETIAMPDHPIEKGLKPIESWDETYVHEMHNEKDRTVLGYREEAGKKEPYTWTRTHGKGRVFYTAWGHDERTWGNDNFIDLLERGIRWSAGDWALASAAPLKPYQYTEVDLPNYQPDKPRDSTGGEKMPMQLPLGPAESVKHMVLPPGFEAKLVASDPQIKKPICMAFDERGRLWLAETVDYPNDKFTDGSGHDQITICEDADGDGVADKFTIFADKLSIPTSMVFCNGGLIVSHAPDILFLKDTDGDGKANVKKVLFTGFGLRDTHAGPSNLRWGLDGWIYGTVGYSGFKGTVGGQELTFGQGLFRFKPDGSRLEFLASTTNNTWGLGFGEDWNIFGSTANGNPSFYLSVPNRYYEQVKGMAAGRLDAIADTYRFYPITTKVRQVDFHGGYTAGAGHALYTARTYPREYWNRIAFVAEPTAHIVGQFIIEPQGSGFAARNNFNLLSSNDEWTSPIAAEVGPDGQVWIIDWYAFVVQHNPIPKGFEQGKGNAFITPLRDKIHGRVYRLVYKDGKPSQQFGPAGMQGGKPGPQYVDLSKATSEQLVAALKSDNMFWRTHAQRLLVEKGDKSVVPALIALVKDCGVDEIGLNPAAVHALWALSDLGVFAESDAAALAAGEAALKHPAASVRKAAVETLARTTRSAEVMLAADVLNDPDPNVRKSALLTLAELPETPVTGDAIYSMLARNDVFADRWLVVAATVAAAKNEVSFLAAALAAHQPGAKAADVPEALSNVVPNSSFEEVFGDTPRAWHVRNYAGESRQMVAGQGHTGISSAKLETDAGADTSWCVDVPVARNTDYRLSGWIKTRGVEPIGKALGALLNIHNTKFQTPAITGTHDWQKVKVEFNSGDRTSVSINCLLGGYGLAKGFALFDDVTLCPVHPGSAMSSGQERVLEAVVNDYAQRGPVDTVVEALESMKSADAAFTSAVIGTMSRAWPQSAPPKISDADAEQLRDVMKSLSPESRDYMLVLVQRWGRADLFAKDMAVSAGQFRAAVKNSALPADQRAAASRRLLVLDDSPASVDAVLSIVTPLAPPDMQVAMLESLSASHNVAVGRSIVAKWEELTPAAQKTAIGLMLRRQPWALALLTGVRSNKINGKDLALQDWEALVNFPDSDVATMARKLQSASGQAPTTTTERTAIVDKLLPLATKPGDIGRGKIVFEKNCMVCHTLEAQGGKVGPELTGVGARPRADVLLDVLDPNRSVEGTFRQWTAKTADDVIIGRLLSESQTSVEIIDAAGMVHVLQRDQIKALTSSNRSVMPEGFEKLPPEDLTDLMEFLSTSKVKH